MELRLFHTILLSAASHVTGGRQAENMKMTDMWGRMAVSMETCLYYNMKAWRHGDGGRWREERT